MTLLRIDLQEGFQNDTVIIRVGGKQVFRQVGVTTKLMLGYAETLEVEVPEGPVRVRIKVPNRKLALTIPLEGTGTNYLGVYLEGGKIAFRTMDETMGYA